MLSSWLVLLLLVAESAAAKANLVIRLTNTNWRSVLDLDGIAMVDTNMNGDEEESMNSE